MKEKKKKQKRLGIPVGEKKGRSASKDSLFRPERVKFNGSTRASRKSGPTQMPASLGVGRGGSTGPNVVGAYNEMRGTPRAGDPGIDILPLSRGGPLSKKVGLGRVGTIPNLLKKEGKEEGSHSTQTNEGKASRIGRKGGGKEEVASGNRKRPSEELVWPLGPAVLQKGTTPFAEDTGHEKKKGVCIHEGVGGVKRES